MSHFEPRDPAFETRVRASFARQTLMTTIGVRLTRVTPGEVEIELPFREDLGQQHGFIHGGIVTAIVDTEPEAAVLTVEFKLNFVAPARGERLVALGRVTKPGRILTVCLGEVVALNGAEEKPVATMLATMMAVRERTDLPGGI